MSNIKCQNKSKIQTPNGRTLEIVNWELFGDWKLGFGILALLFFPLPLLAAVCNPNSIKLCNPLDTANNLVDIIGFVIKTLLPISGAVALLMLIVGAIYWIISGGASEQVQKGKDTVVWALLGAVVIIGSYVALSFILRALTTGIPGYQQSGASPPAAAPPPGP